MTITIDGLDYDYFYQPAHGDGWHDEHFPECVIVEKVTRDGVDVTDEYTDEELDEVGEIILDLLKER